MFRGRVIVPNSELDRTCDWPCYGSEFRTARLMNAPYLKCHCFHCGGGIEFNASDVGACVECPHCQQETSLKNPPVEKSEKPMLWKVISLCMLVAIIVGFLGMPLLRKDAKNGGAKSSAAVYQAARVSGQVFIVQQNRETVKMSMVAVQVVNTRTANARLAERRIQARDNLTKLEAQQAKINLKLPYLQKLQPLLRTSASQKERLAQQAIELIRIYQNGATSTEIPEFYRKDYRTKLTGAQASYSRAKSEYQAAVAQSDKTDSELERLESELKDVEARISYWSSPAIYFDTAWPNVIAETTTDADGKFMLELPSEGEFTITAHTSRLTTDGKESFGWLVPVRAGSGDILLNNNNLAVLPPENPDELIANATTGNSDAQFRLAVLHLTGNGALQDSIEAYKWLTIAATGGNALAEGLRNDVSQTLNQSEQNEGKRRALAFMNAKAPPL